MNSVKYEKGTFALLAGYWTYYIHTLIYASLTVGITNGITDKIKRSKGLKENQI